MASPDLPLGSHTQDSLALYIHWPFCLSKCPYCDFNSRVDTIGPLAPWREAFESEMRFYAALTGPRPLHSLFFGGGTPSLMPPELVAFLIETAAHFWPLTQDCEITLEANPTSFESAKFEAFRAAGVNRLSLGVQSLREEALKLLGRQHSVQEARKAFETASSLFPRTSFDLIYARADQTEESWHDELKEALSWGADHMALYQLTIEEGTVFYKQRTTHPARTASASCAENLFAQTRALMQEAGLPAYEISNYARPGQESRHNLTYWHYGDYCGLGPGAHGRLTQGPTKQAFAAARTPAQWQELVKKQGAGFETRETLSRPAAQTEALMMGLRLKEGLSFKRWEKLFATPFEAYLPRPALEPFAQEGWLFYEETALRLSEEGIARLDALLPHLLARAHNEDTP